jgi:hypothetical protein
MAGFSSRLIQNVKCFLAFALMDQPKDTASGLIGENRPKA